MVLCLLRSLLRGTKLTSEDPFAFLLFFILAAWSLDVRAGTQEAIWDHEIMRWVWKNSKTEAARVPDTVKLLTSPVLSNSRLYKCERKINFYLKAPWWTLVICSLTDTHPMIRGHKKHYLTGKLHMKKLCQIYCFT